MTFKEATDRLAALGITATELADVAGVSLNSISRARMVTGNSRPPPREWKSIVRTLATARAAALSALASELADA